MNTRMKIAIPLLSLALGASAEAATAQPWGLYSSKNTGATMLWATFYGHDVNNPEHTVPGATNSFNCRLLADRYNRDRQSIMSKPRSAQAKYDTRVAFADGENGKRNALRIWILAHEQVRTLCAWPFTAS